MHILGHWYFMHWTHHSSYFRRLITVNNRLWRNALRNTSLFVDSRVMSVVVSSFFTATFAGATKIEQTQKAQSCMNELVKQQNTHDWHIQSGTIMWIVFMFLNIIFQHADIIHTCRRSLECGCASSSRFRLTQYCFTKIDLNFTA